MRSAHFSAEFQRFLERIESQKPSELMKRERSLGMTFVSPSRICHDRRVPLSMGTRWLLRLPLPITFSFSRALVLPPLRTAPTSETTKRRAHLHEYFSAAP